MILIRDKDKETHPEIVAYIATGILFFSGITLLAAVIWFILRFECVQTQCTSPQHSAPRSYLLPQFIRKYHSGPAATVGPGAYSSHAQSPVPNS